MGYSIKTSYFIGICAFALSVSTYFIHGKVSLEGLYYSLAILFASQITYKILRLDKQIKELKNLKHLLKTALIPFFLIGIFLTLAKLSLNQYLFLGLSILLTLLYSSHIWRSLEKIALRNNGIIKLLSIGIVWAITTTLIPLLNFNEVFQTKHYLHVAVICSFIIFLTIPFELNDLLNKKINNYKTFPEIIGEEMTIKIGRMIAITTWLGSGFISLQMFLAMSVCVIVYLKFLNQNLKEFTLQKLTLRFDGIILLFSIIVILITSLMTTK